MSEYYLADQRARERARQRALDRKAEQKTSAQSQNVKVTLLGDFLFPSSEPQGCDPYNSLNGRSTREAWTTRRDRR
jgi:hypothetical protein